MKSLFQVQVCIFETQNLQLQYFHSSSWKDLLIYLYQFPFYQRFFEGDRLYPSVSNELLKDCSENLLEQIFTDRIIESYGTIKIMEVSDLVCTDVSNKMTYRFRVNK